MVEASPPTSAVAENTVAPTPAMVLMGLASVCVANFAFGSSLRAVVMVLPQVASSFQISKDTARWLILGYQVSLVGFGVITGQLGDHWGRKRVYALGTGVFGAACLLLGVAPSFPVLLLSRVLQGLGAAALMGNGRAVLAAALPAQRLGRGIGLAAAAMQLGLGLGPWLAGYLVAMSSWRQVFLMNAPVALLALILVRGLPEKKLTARAPRPDIAGTIVLSSAYLCLLLTLEHVMDAGGKGRALSFGVATGVLMLLFVRLERRARDPIVDIGLLRVRAVWSGIAGLGLVVLPLYSVVFTLPFFFQGMTNVATTVAGDHLLVMALVSVLCSPFGGRMVERLGAKPPLVLGAFTVALGIGSLSLVGAGVSRLAMTGSMVVIGVGVSMFAPANVVAVLEGAGKRLSTASGLMVTAQNMALGVGVAFTSIMLVFWGERYTLPPGAAGEAARIDVLSVYHATWRVLSCFAFLASLITGVFSPTRQKTSPRVEE